MNEQKIAPVLSDDEIAEIVRKWHESIGSMNALLRATEQALLARVGAVREQMPTEWVQKGLDLAEKLGAQQHGTAWVAMYDHLMSAPEAIRALRGTPAAAVADDEDIIADIIANHAFHDSEHGKAAMDKWQMRDAAKDILAHFAAAPQSSGNPGPLAAVEPSDAMPMQPVVLAADGVVRFKRNRIVDAVYEHSYKHGYGMNEIAVGDFTADERMQFAQLVGYSIGGYAELPYVSDDSYYAASAQVYAASKEGASHG